jgi:hypothetical protein
MDRHLVDRLLQDLVYLLEIQVQARLKDLAQVNQHLLHPHKTDQTLNKVRILRNI